MTYYHHQVLKIRRDYLPKQYLIDSVVRAKQLIDQRFCEAVNLDQLSGESLLSKFHLIRLFKSCYGKTPYQYITEKRISRAETLLREGYAVSETCYQLGFESAASFSLYFKKHTGLSPTDYRKRAISNMPV